jgi:hypothetical protein
MSVPGGFTDEGLNAAGPLAIAMEVNALFEELNASRFGDGHLHRAL